MLPLINRHSRGVSCAAEKRELRNAVVFCWSNKAIHSLLRMDQQSFNEGNLLDDQSSNGPDSCSWKGGGKR